MITEFYYEVRVKVEVEPDLDVFDIIEVKTDGGDGGRAASVIAELLMDDVRFADCLWEDWTERCSE